ncbi:MAG: DUF434 domain-containing protein [Nannocystaceae bacterium]|nr:DUF434 domain-containing protein [bacterium]
MGRGPHQADATLFAASALPSLRAAVADLSWLLGRGYVDPSATKLVGDRHRLRQRQRVAVSRSAAGAEALAARSAKRRSSEALAGEHLAIDAFNVLIGTETALSGGVLLRGVDGALRDLASVHGSYRRVAVTEAALDALVATLVRWSPAAVTWYVDRPVSNSGRLAGWIRERAPTGVAWSVELPHDADRGVIEADAVGCSADARVLDLAPAWTDLVSETVATHAPEAWVVDLRGSGAAW